MKPALFLAAVTVTLAAAPAFADNGQVFDAGAQLRAYDANRPLDTLQCFNGKAISGVSRGTGKALYVQSRQGSIYGLKLEDSCAALDGAKRIVLKADGGANICAGDRSATAILQTDAGPKRCAISVVRALDSREVREAAAGSTRR